MLFFTKSCAFLSISIGTLACLPEICSAIGDNTPKVNEEPTITFTPPKGWRQANFEELPPSVHLMVVGDKQHEFPPSINVAVEPYSGTLKQYLKIVKSINDAKGTEWKDLGTIRTDAGNASLSQVDSQTKWGPVRLMHVILLKNQKIYILTAASLKDEFPSYYKDFFNSMRTLRIKN
jgi:hypothetical protein